MVSDRFMRIKKIPENSMFSGKIVLSDIRFELSFVELGTLDFAGFLEYSIANTLQMQDFSLLLRTP